MILELLAKRHNEWIAMAKSLNAPYPEDLVQDMYLRLHKYVKDPERIMYGDQVNTFFVYVSLKNLLRSQQKNEPNHIELTDHPDAQPTNKHPMEALLFAIEAEVVTWSWYDQKLFRLYFVDQIGSMREIAEETKISERSIWNTLNNCRERIKEACGYEYEEVKRSR